MVLFASLSALMINAMLCNVAIGKGRGLMQWWANFLSVVGQLVGPTISPPVYVKICIARHVRACMCARNACRKESTDSMVNTFITMQTSQDTIQIHRTKVRVRPVLNANRNER